VKRGYKRKCLFETLTKISFEMKFIAILSTALMVSMIEAAPTPNPNPTPEPIIPWIVAGGFGYLGGRAYQKRKERKEAKMAAAKPEEINFIQAPES
jgi:uncharacterized membrane protein